jgi:hypothetical protein
VTEVCHDCRSVAPCAVHTGPRCSHGQPVDVGCLGCTQALLREALQKLAEWRECARQLAADRDVVLEVIHKRPQGTEGWPLLELVTRIRELEDAGILLPGWQCTQCQAFNGTAKECLLVCRCCGAPRP